MGERQRGEEWVVGEKRPGVFVPFPMLSMLTVFPLQHWESFALAVSPVTVAPVAFGGSCTFVCDKGCSLLPASDTDTAFLLEPWFPFQMGSHYRCVQSRSPSPTGMQAWSSGRKCFARLVDMIGMKVPQAGLERPVVLGEWLWGPCPSGSWSTCLSSCTLSLSAICFVFLSAVWSFWIALLANPRCWLMNNSTLYL